MWPARNLPGNFPGSRFREISPSRKKLPLPAVTGTLFLPQEIIILTLNGTKNLLSTQVLSRIRKVLVEKIQEFCNFLQCIDVLSQDRKNRAIHELDKIEPGTYSILLVKKTNIEEGKCLNFLSFT
jgi:hypothetical protein